MQFSSLHLHFFNYIVVYLVRAKPAVRRGRKANGSCGAARWPGCLGPGQRGFFILWGAAPEADHPVILGPGSLHQGRFFGPERPEG